MDYDVLGVEISLDGREIIANMGFMQVEFKASASGDDGDYWTPPSFEFDIEFVKATDIDPEEFTEQYEQELTEEIKQKAIDEAHSYIEKNYTDSIIEAMRDY